MVQEYPPTTPLPDDVLALMRRVIELVDLLYWTPVPTKGSEGYAIVAERAPLKSTEAASDEEGGMEGSPTPSKASKVSKRSRRLPWPADADLETRKAYGTALMCGHGNTFSSVQSVNTKACIVLPRLRSRLVRGCIPG